MQKHIKDVWLNYQSKKRRGHACPSGSKWEILNMVEAMLEELCELLKKLIV